MTRDGTIAVLACAAILLAALVLAFSQADRADDPEVPVLDRLCAEARANHPTRGCP